MDPHTRLRHKIKMVSLHEGKEDLSEKITPLLKKIKTMKKNVRIICCDNAGENKTPEENCEKNTE